MRLRPGFAIDLGTVNTLIYVAGRGLVLEQPSVIALERATGKVAATGEMAKALSGKEPEGLQVVWPLRDGVIADFRAATLMLNAYLHRARAHRGLVRPVAVICVPRCATSIERRAVEATVEGRSPHCIVHLVDEPVAAWVGAEADPESRNGTLVVDIGGGTTDIAVVAGAKVVRARSLKVGGNAMDEAIGRAVKATFGLSIGSRTCEELKIALGLTGGGAAWVEVLGIDVAHEELRSVRIPGELVASALQRIVRSIVLTVNEVLSDIPPDLAGDVVQRRIQMAGGGSLLLGLAERVAASTGLETSVVDDPLRCVVRGAAEILKRGNRLGVSKAA